MTEEQNNVVSRSSVEAEKDPEFHPQDPSGVVEKLGQEMEGEPGVGGKAKKVLQELDRQFGGEYERRENPEAAGPHQGAPSADAAERPSRSRGGSEPDESVAAPAAAAEEERFEGLVNEPGNPPREPDLQER